MIRPLTVFTVSLIIVVLALAFVDLPALMAGSPSSDIGCCGVPR